MELILSPPGTELREVTPKDVLPLAHRYESIISLFDQSVRMALSEASTTPEPLGGVSLKLFAQQLDSACYRLQLWAVDISRQTPTRRGSAVDVLGVVDKCKAPIAEKLYKIFDQIAKTIASTAPQHETVTNNRDAAMHSLMTSIRSLGELISEIRRCYDLDTQKQTASDNLGSLVLCLDGGGVRSISGLLILKELMLKVQAVSKKYAPDEYESIIDDTRHPRDFFDYIFGSSTGGLSAIMLGRLKMTVDEAMENFTKYAAQIFTKGRLFSFRGPIPLLRPKYSEITLERAIQTVVDTYEPDKNGSMWRRNTFAALDDPCKTGVLATTSDGKPFLFRTYDHFSDEKPGYVLNPGGSTSLPISVVARATTAAPTYFSKVKLGHQTFVDAGFGHNNPSEIAFTEVHQMFAQYRRDSSKALRADKTHDGRDVQHPIGNPKLLTTIEKDEPQLVQSNDMSSCDEIQHDPKGESLLAPAVEAQSSGTVKEEEKWGESDRDSPGVDLIVSIGTGRSSFKSNRNPKNNMFGFRSLLHTLRNMATDSENIHNRMQIMSRISHRRLDYYRFNVEGPMGTIRLDEWKVSSRKQTTLEAITQYTNEYLQRPEVQAALERCALQLFQLRRR